MCTISKKENLRLFYEKKIFVARKLKSKTFIHPS
jgi:hypothetical protein